MRKRIFKFNPLSALIILATLFSACVRQTPNRAHNENANKTIVEGSAQAGNPADGKINTEPNSETSNVKTSATPDKEQRQQAIDRYVAGVAKVSDATEYKEARKIIYGDLDGDGDEDAAAQFTIEGMGGGNNYGFYLAVFRNENGKFAGITDDVIGGKLNRDITLTKIEDGKMLFDTKSYDTDDGACCPSIEGKTAYILEGKKLIEKK